MTFDVRGTCNIFASSIRLNRPAAHQRSLRPSNYDVINYWDRERGERENGADDSLPLPIITVVDDKLKRPKTADQSEPILCR